VGSWSFLFERETGSDHRGRRLFDARRIPAGAAGLDRHQGRLCRGDCGACSVLVGVPEAGVIRYRVAVSCIQSLYQLDGKHVVTIEGLTPRSGQSPIQQAMVDHHGSQCGFCTPGFVVALEGVFESEARVDEGALRTGLAGNLCRCTGYVPILEAGLSVPFDGSRAERLSSLYASRPMYEELAARAGAPLLIETARRVFFRPRGWTTR